MLSGTTIRFVLVVNNSFRVSIFFMFYNWFLLYGRELRVIIIAIMIIIIILKNVKRLVELARRNDTRTNYVSYNRQLPVIEWRKCNLKFLISSSNVPTTASQTRLRSIRSNYRVGHVRKCPKTRFRYAQRVKRLMAAYLSAIKFSRRTRAIDRLFGGTLVPS